MELRMHLGAGRYEITARHGRHVVTADLAKLDRDGRREARAQVNKLWRWATTPRRPKNRKKGN